MTNNMNTIELSDEQLAEVTGGGDITSTINIAQLAGNFASQNNAVDGSTAAFLSGGDGNSLLGVQGSTNNVGSTFVGINSNHA
jgi:bacteriocin-like protein